MRRKPMSAATYERWERARRLMDGFDKLHRCYDFFPDPYCPDQWEIEHATAVFDREWYRHPAVASMQLDGLRCSELP